MDFIMRENVLNVHGVDIAGLQIFFLKLIDVGHASGKYLA
jgi:hypothetical protein